MRLPCSNFWQCSSVDMVGGGDKGKPQDTLVKIVGFMTDVELLKASINTT
jgi:hypothetical protein